MVAISMSMETKGHCQPICTKVRPLTAPNLLVKRDETAAPVAQHHAADAGERIITNLLNMQHDFIL